MSNGELELKIVRMNRVWSGLTAEQIRGWMLEGRVKPDDLVRPVGATKWIKASLAPELAGEAISLSGESVSSTLATGAAATDDLGITVPSNRRPRRKRRILEDSAMDMMPMIDVTFQLLIFFMFTQQLANPNPIEVPMAAYGRGVLPDGKQAILIDAEGHYFLGEGTKPENESSLDNLVREVAANARAADAPLEVIISAHKRSVHLPARDLIQRLGEVENLGPVRLGVEERQ